MIKMSVKDTQMSVLRWPRHKYHGAWCCNGEGSTGAPDGCISCILAHCMVCGAGEAELTTDCPGRKTTDGERYAVVASMLDYKHGRWEAKRHEARL